MKRFFPILTAAVMLVFIFYLIIEDDDLLVTFTRPTVLVLAVAIGLWWYHGGRSHGDRGAAIADTRR
jgi:hypothetical protein